MLPLLAALLATGAVDGGAALGHASKLAALGPHPWGSPRGSAAAAYVQAQFREAGLDEVRLQEFEDHGLHGANVIGVLRAPGPEFVLIGAHHDTAPEAPGAYDDGGGVGVLIEAARALARERSRPRSLVFVSFDGEEAWATGKATTTGSRAYIRALGENRKNLTAALVIEMCGFGKGSPVFQPIAYADPLRPGRSLIAPAWLVEAALTGAREANVPFGIGDPLIPWLYQPLVRLFRVPFYGDDLSFVQAGLPAIFSSDSSFTSFYPWYHQAADTADKLDAAALARMGQGVLGIVRALGRAPRGPASEPDWFVAFGKLIGATALLALGVLSLLPGLLRAFASGGLRLPARILHALLFAVLLWRHPVPALWILLLPNLAAVASRGWVTGLALLPALAMAGLGVAAWRRGFVAGVWPAPWELCVFGLVLGLALVRLTPQRPPISWKKTARRSR